MSNRQIHGSDIDRVEQLAYTPLEKKYLHVQQANVVMVYLVFMAIGLCWLLVHHESIRLLGFLLTEGLLFVALLVNLWILPKAYDFKGFAIREHDITYRSGILFPSVITIPFCKIQQVSVSQNPVSRYFGLYSVDLVNGAQLESAAHIPGLSEARANKIKALVIERVHHENS